MKELSLEEFNSILQTNVYGQQYNDLIQSIRDQNRGKKKKKGYNLHHVHPKALGGLKGEVILLSYYEHCLAHILLAKAIPCYETLSPITFLSRGTYKNLSDLDKLTLEEAYGWSKELQKANIEAGKKLSEYYQNLPEEEKERRRQKRSLKMKELRANESEEQKEHRKKVRLEKYHNLSPEERSSRIQNRVEKTKKTKAEFTEERWKEISDKLKQTKQSKSDEEKKKIVERWQKSVQSRTSEQEALIRKHRSEAQKNRTPEQKAETYRKFKENYRGNAHKGKHWHVDPLTGKHIYTDE